MYLGLSVTRSECECGRGKGRKLLIVESLIWVANRPLNFRFLIRHGLMHGKYTVLFGGADLNFVSSLISKVLVTSILCRWDWYPTVSMATSKFVPADHSVYVRKSLHYANILFDDDMIDETSIRYHHATSLHSNDVIKFMMTSSLDDVIP